MSREGSWRSEKPSQNRRLPRDRKRTNCVLRAKHGQFYGFIADDRGDIGNSADMGMRSGIRLTCFVSRLIKVVLIKRMWLTRCLIGVFPRVLHQTQGAKDCQ